MDLQAETCGININLVDNLILYILFQINTHTRLLPTNCTNIWIISSVVFTLSLCNNNNNNNFNTV